MNQKIKTYLKDSCLAVCAAIVASLNLQTFVNAGNLVPGGFSGLSIFITRAVKSLFDIDLSYSIIYLLFNLPCAFLVIKEIGKRFTVVSLIDVVLTSLLVTIIPRINITSDPLLIAVFGGIVGGISSSLVLKANACGGGTDFLALFFAKKKQKSLWNQFMILNITIIILSAFMYGWESALYSIIYQFVNTQVVKMFDTRYERNCMFIIPEQFDKVMEIIKVKYHRGATVIDGEGAFTNDKKKIIYTVCGKYETEEITKAIKEVDPKAFINIMASERILGNFHEKPY